MAETWTTVKAALLGAIFAITLGAMFFIPVWFVLAFVSRLITGRIVTATFVLAGLGAAVFLGWTFHLVFGYFRKGFVARHQG